MPATSQSDSGRYAELLAIAAVVAAGCGPSVRVLDGDSGGTAAIATGESAESDTDLDPHSSPHPDPSPNPDPPTRDPVCGSQDKRVLYFTPQAYADAWQVAVSGGHCEEDAGGGDESGASSGTGADTEGVTWDEVNPACVMLCESLVCDAVSEGSGSSIESVSCDLADADAENLRALTCCFSVQDTGGRGHACVASAGRATSSSDSVRWLERLAHAEAASVHAFAALEVELADAGAPDALLQRVRRAAADEVRHASAIDVILGRLGGVAERARTRAFAKRSLVELAIENAVEGCVAESAAAMIAVHQGRNARSQTLRRAMQEIATDELRHAALAWDLHAWLMARLSDAEQRRVTRAGRAAADAAFRETTSTGADAAQWLGLPDRPTRHSILGRLADGPWRALRCA